MVVRRGRRSQARVSRERDPAVVARAYLRLLAGSNVATAQRRFNIRIRGDRIPPLADLIDSCRSGGISMVVLQDESSGSPVMNGEEHQVARGTSPSWQAAALDLDADTERRAALTPDSTGPAFIPGAPHF